MTVRDLANEILDMQVWEAFIVWMVAVFAASFTNAMVREVTKSVRTRKGRKA